jgi:hypothetical protein
VNYFSNASAKVLCHLIWLQGVGIGRSLQVNHAVKDVIDRARTLHSAPGYITPKEKLEGRESLIFAERNRKLEQARERGKARRLAGRQAADHG